MNKPGGFIGREALAAAREAAPDRKLCCLVLDDPRAVALGNEPVRVDGAVIGRVTSGGYGYAVERSIAYAYLPLAAAGIGQRGEVDVFGEWVGCTVSAEPLYDPEGAAAPLLAVGERPGGSDERLPQAREFGRGELGPLGVTLDGHQPAVRVRILERLDQVAVVMRAEAGGHQASSQSVGGDALVVIGIDRCFGERR